MVASCKECGKYKICSEAMPQQHINEVWRTTQEKRKWMRKYLVDCFIEQSFWDMVTNNDNKEQKDS